MNYYNYFTEIEEYFVRRRGKHLLLSPMDWRLIATWRDAGIPLNVALRGIDIAMDGFFARQHRGNSKISSLCYCHDAVMTEYADYLEAHVGESPAEDQAPAAESKTVAARNDGPGAEEISGFITERIGEIKLLSAKQYSENVPEGLQRVISRLEEVLQNHGTYGPGDMEKLERDLAIIDDLLVTELRALVPEEVMSEWEKEAKKELKVYKKRLPKETYEKIHGNFVRDKIHRRFTLGELSLFRL
jgi:ElaB/YqjD/DUF883 family membrane-anchored ribosome-binding protein